MPLIARALTAAIRAIMPRARSDWAAAMIAEAAGQTETEAAVWLFGCLGGAIMARLQELALFGATICIAVSITLFFEWHTDEPLVVLPALLLVTSVAGAVMPRRFLLVGLISGWAILSAHALSTASGLMIPRYQKHAPILGDWIAMSLLVVPALLAAYAGSRVGRLFAK
jgi:hypothetical protein